VKGIPFSNCFILASRAVLVFSPIFPSEFSPRASTLIHNAHFAAKDLDIFPLSLDEANPTREAW